MMLIADSGGSGTTWCLIRNTKTDFFRSVGLHPDVVNDATLMPAELQPYALEVDQLNFYGTGCARAEKAQKIVDLLSIWFPNAEIMVYSDLMALAHAYWGNKAGYVGVLGTGASMAWFNGGNIEFNAVSKGKYYDPGGGARIGKIMGNLYQNKKIPDDLVARLNVYTNKEKEISEHRFTQFAMQYLEHPFLSALFKDEISGYFEYYMPTWEKHPANLVLGGTIAWLGRKIIQQIADGYDVKVKKIIKEPINFLVKYYRSSSNSSSI